MFTQLLYFCNKSNVVPCTILSRHGYIKKSIYYLDKTLKKIILNIKIRRSKLEVNLSNFILYLNVTFSILV